MARPRFSPDPADWPRFDGIEALDDLLGSGQFTTRRTSGARYKVASVALGSNVPKR
jgi:hypothetical protein